MKICVFGNKTATRALIAHLVNSGANISGLITLGSDLASSVQISGEDNRLTAFASTHGIKVFHPDSYSLKSDRDIEFFSRQNFDLGLCAGWQRLIPGAILDSFEHGVFGWHGSGFKLPNGRGRSPLNWSLRLGLEVIYHNCFRYSYGVDDGEVFDCELIQVAADDYISDLQRKALEHIKSSSIRLIEEIRQGTLSLTPQAPHPFITFPPLTEVAGELLPDRMQCGQAINIIRSCSHPFPGAFIRVEDKVLRIWSARICGSDGPTGEVHVTDSVTITFLDGCIVTEDFELIV